MGELFTKKEAEFIREQVVGHLATHSDDKTIHLVPICYVYDGKAIYFTTATWTKKLANIIRNPGVTLAVDRYTENWDYEQGLYVVGRAIVLNGEAKDYARALFNRRYPQELNFPPESWGPMIRITATRVVSWGINRRYADEIAETVSRSGKLANNSKKPQIKRPAVLGSRRSTRPLS
jgi:nitroimidazol reductase NimA-like FMN-containing flavoprotein (pyridoxamine 5'-phosphate oxidase superfamily)